MKKHSKIIFKIIIVIFIAIFALLIWQYDNVMSVINFARYSKEEIAQKIDDKKEELQTVLEKYVDSPARDFTLDEEQMIMSGELSPEDALKKLAENVDTAVNQGVNEANKGKYDKEVDSIVSEYVTKFYGLKAHYLGVLGKIENDVINDYVSLPKDEQNSNGKQKIITKYIGKAGEYEKQCDGQVKSLLASLTKELKSKGGDLEIIKVIEKSYEEQKTLKKAYYLSLLEN